MDRSIRSNLARDYNTVNATLKSLLSGVQANHKIRNKKYLNPELVDGKPAAPVLALENPGGMFRYFLRLRTLLEYALRHEELPKKIPRGLEDTPEYLRYLK